MSLSNNTKAHPIDDVQVTTDCLTGCAGLNLFVRYLHGIDLYPHPDRLFKRFSLSNFLYSVVARHKPPTAGFGDVHSP